MLLKRNVSKSYNLLRTTFMVHAKSRSSTGHGGTYFIKFHPPTMAEHQAKDNQLAPVLEWVREGKISPQKPRYIKFAQKKHPATNVSISPAYFKGWGFCIVFTSIMMWNTTNWCYLKGTIKKSFSHYTMISDIRGSTER